MYITYMSFSFFCLKEFLYKILECHIMENVKKKLKTKVYVDMTSSKRDLNFKVENSFEILVPPLLSDSYSFHLNQALYSFLIDKANNFP